MPDEPKYYHHGCGSASDCKLEEVAAGYAELKRGLAPTGEGAYKRSMAEFETMRADVETPRARAVKRGYGE